MRSSYELVDHLGNIHVIVSDRKLPVDDGTYSGGVKINSTPDGIFDFYEPDVIVAQDFYPYHSIMPGRNFNSNAYRYGGANGQEKDDEIAGSGNSYTAEYWQYSPRPVMRWNLDPKPNPSISPYAVYGGNPIWFTDQKGDTIKVTTSKGKYLFSLDDGKTKLTTMTAKAVYDQGTQWFAPKADNYMPLLDKAKDLSSNSSLKHFTWQQIADFSEVDRWMSSYAQGGSGDWKSSSEGADGFFLVTVGGEPYWSDAIGQIPFAIDYFTDVYEDNGDKKKSIKMTLLKGMEYGEGEFFGGDTDVSNTYDNHFLLKGAKWAAKRYNAEKGSGWFGDDYDLKKTDYSPDNLETE